MLRHRHAENKRKINIKLLTDVQQAVITAYGTNGSKAIHGI